MMQRCRRLGFPVEALPGFFILQQMVSEELERNGSFELGVHGLVDHTHAALAELPRDLVVAYGPADHLRLNCTASGIPGGIATLQQESTVTARRAKHAISLLLAGRACNVGRASLSAALATFTWLGLV